MPRRSVYPDQPEGDDDDIDPEGPNESEMDYSDEPDLAVCPHCRKMIYEESERCPHCGEYVTPGAKPLSGWAWIVIGLMILALILLLLRMA